MKCPECVRLGLKSHLRPAGGYTTLLNYEEFYDEDGHYHFHDPNSSRSTMVCSNGHTLRVVRFNKCHCEWRGGEDKIEIVEQEPAKPAEGESR